MVSTIDENNTVSFFGMCAVSILLYFFTSIFRISSLKNTKYKMRQAHPRVRRFAKIKMFYHNIFIRIKYRDCISNEHI